MRELNQQLNNKISKAIGVGRACATILEISARVAADGDNPAVNRDMLVESVNERVNELRKVLDELMQARSQTLSDSACLACSRFADEVDSDQLCRDCGRENAANMNKYSVSVNRQA